MANRLNHNYINLPCGVSYIKAMGEGEMREIKFRGKTKNGEWKFGSLLVFNGNYYIATPEKGYGYASFPRHIDIKDAYEVIPESVGQYIEIKDKLKKEIYGGDILDIDDGDDMFIGRAVVKFVDGKFQYDDGGNGVVQDIDGRIEKVIGNIYENKDLLK